MSTNRITLIVILLVAAFAGPAGAATHAHTRTIPMATLEGYASQIAGSPTTIACDSTGGEGGYVKFDGVIHLEPWMCPALRGIRRDVALNDPAYAVLVLQHEATHIALHSYDEGLTECTAVSNRWQLVRLFKLPARRARSLMSGEMLAHLAVMPPAYRTDC